MRRWNHFVSSLCCDTGWPSGGVANTRWVSQDCGASSVRVMTHAKIGHLIHYESGFGALANRVPTRTDHRGGPNTGTPSMSFDTKSFVYPGRNAHMKASGFRPAANRTVSWNTVNGTAQIRRHHLLVAREPSRDAPVRPFAGLTLKSTAKDLVRRPAGLPAELKRSNNRNK